jgi:hypothetical protein
MHYATRRKVAVLIYDEVIGFFNLPNPSSYGVDSALAEVSARNLPGGRERSARKAENLTDLYERIV